MKIYIKLKGEREIVRIFHPAHEEKLFAAYKSSLNDESTIQSFPAYRIEIETKLKNQASSTKFVFVAASWESYEALLKISIS